MQLTEVKTRVPLAEGFSVRQAKRLMAALPRDEAAAICDARNRIAHFDPRAREKADRVHHPLVEGSGEQRAELVKALARCAPGTPFAKVCVEMAKRMREFDRVGPLSGDQEAALREYGFLVAAEVTRFVLQVWTMARQIKELQANHETLGSGNLHVRRALKSPFIPLWVVSALSDVSDDDLRSMTAEDVLQRAGLDEPPRRRCRGHSRESLLAEAHYVLGLLRELAGFNEGPAAWRDLLVWLAERLEDADCSEASRVQEVRVPPRPCHPPGELMMAAPRVPRAPGCSVPRLSIDKGRHRLQHCGGRGGRLTV